MATLLDTSFDDNYAVWTQKPATTPRPRLLWGCEGGYGTSCQDCGLLLQFATEHAPLTSVTARAQLALDLTGSQTSLVMRLFNGQLTPPTSECSTAGEFEAILSALADGSLVLTIYNPNGSVGTAPSSAAGVVSVVGVMNAIQWSLHFTADDTVQYNVVVNNGSVISGTYTAPSNYISVNPCTGLPATSNAGVNIFAIEPVVTSGIFGQHRMFTYGQAQLENTVNITTYDPCAQLFDALATQCSHFTFPDTPTIDCEDEHIIITGSGFPPHTMALTGPTGDPVAFTVVSLTDTEMVLTLDDGFTPGTYCLTTTGPETTVCGSLFCDTTTYPICRKRRFALPFSQNMLVFLYRLQFLIQSGESPNASITVRLSRDGGDTWPITRTLTAGTLGDAAFRVFTTSLGQGRNWVCEFITSEPYFWALIECYADIEEGTR